MGKIRISELLVNFPFLRAKGSTELEIEGLNLCNRDTCKKSILSYVTSSDYVDHVNNNTSVKCLLVTEEDIDAYSGIIESRNGVLLISFEPERDLYAIHSYLLKHTELYEKFNFPSRIGQNSSIHLSAVIYEGVIIGDNAVIGANSVIKPGTIIGNKVVIGCNSVIGGEGFQIINAGGVPTNVEHIGQTIILDNVYIGDNVSIAKSLFEGATTLENNVKVDSLCRIAHNCTLKENCVITAGVILCGSAEIGKGAWIGVNSSILNRVVVGDNALVGIGSVVTRNVSDGTTVYGVPAKEHKTPDTGKAL